MAYQVNWIQHSNLMLHRRLTPAITVKKVTVIGNFIEFIGVCNGNQTQKS